MSREDPEADGKQRLSGGLVAGALSIRTTVAAILLHCAFSFLASVASGGTQAQPSVEWTRTVCVSVEMAGLPERGDLRASWLAGFKRPFRLDSLLVERFLGGHRWADAGKIRNQVRVAAVPCPQNAPDSKARLWVPVFDELSDARRRPDLGVSLRLGGGAILNIDWVVPHGSRAALDSLPSERTIRAIWVAVCSPDSARSAPDTMWEQTAVNWAERPANEIRAEEIHGWLAGMTALQAVQRRLGLLPDSLDLVFDSRGRNR